MASQSQAGGFIDGIAGARPLGFVKPQKPAETRPSIQRGIPVRTIKAPSPAHTASDDGPATPRADAKEVSEAATRGKARLTPRQREAILAVLDRGGSIPEADARELLDGRILRSLVRTGMLDLFGGRYRTSPAARDLAAAREKPRPAAGAMTPEELKARCEALFGARRGWKRMLARAIDVREQTVSKWLAGTLPVPEYLAAIVESLESLRAAGRIMPPRFQRSRAR